MRARVAAFALMGLAALFLLSGPVRAQVAVPDPYATQLARQLARLEGGLASDGFRRIEGPFTGALAAGEAQRYNVVLRAGFRYIVVGACDNDCRDLDMRLIDQNGHVITVDEASARAASVSSQPRWTGPFAIEVRMAQCAEAICYYAFNIYAR